MSGVSQLTPQTVCNSDEGNQKIGIQDIIPRNPCSGQFTIQKSSEINASSLAITQRSQVSKSGSLDQPSSYKQLHSHPSLDQINRVISLAKPHINYQQSFTHNTDRTNNVGNYMLQVRGLNPAAPPFRGLNLLRSDPSRMNGNLSPTLWWNAFPMDPTSSFGYPAQHYEFYLRYPFSIYENAMSTSGGQLLNKYNQQSFFQQFDRFNFKPGINSYGTAYVNTPAYQTPGLGVSPKLSLVSARNKSRGAQFKGFSQPATHKSSVKREPRCQKLSRAHNDIKVPGELTRTSHPGLNLKMESPVREFEDEIITLESDVSNRNFRSNENSKITQNRNRARNQVQKRMRNPKKNPRKHFNIDVQEEKVVQMSLASLSIGETSSYSPHTPNNKSTKNPSESSQDDGRYNICENTPLNTPKQFLSERRHVSPIKLRARRGQTMSTLDPPTNIARKMYLNNREISFTASNNRRPPPKIDLGLLTADKTNVKTSAPLNQNDPFITRVDSRKSTRTSDIFNQYITQKDSFENFDASNSSSQSPSLFALVAMGHRTPSIDEVFNSIPFVEYCRLAKEDTCGVVKIKNIPYSINRSEILAFLGRKARIISEYEHEPIHIIMERVTSKTLDCYVEFINFQEAVNAVNRFEKNRNDGRFIRIGQRYVNVELSSQECLMRDLFPKAKNVKWIGPIPEIIPRDPNDQLNSGFKGFVSNEELVMLVKHVETPQRSLFAKECPQRPYECIISTLFKYPWYMVDYITIKERESLHQTTIKLLMLLKHRIEIDPENIFLTPMLYNRVWRAALRCQGFSPSQKDDIALVVDLPWDRAQEFGLPLYASFWNRLWAIGPQPHTPNDWYIARIREITLKKQKKQHFSPTEEVIQNSGDNEKFQQEQRDDQNLELFGLLHKYIDYGQFGSLEFSDYSLAQVASAEWAGIEKVLRETF